MHKNAPKIIITLRPPNIYSVYVPGMVLFRYWSEKCNSSSSRTALARVWCDDKIGVVWLKTYFYLLERMMVKCLVGLILG